MTALTAPRRGHGRKDIDYRLIAALVMGASLRHAAEQVDVSVSADERRLADPEFRVRLVEAKNDLMDRRLGASASAGLAAIDHLLQVVVGDVKPSPGRIAAARALLGASVSLDRHTSGRLPWPPRFTPGGTTAAAVAVDVEVANMRARVDEVRARLTIVDDVAVARLEAAGWTCLPPGTAAFRRERLPPAG